MLTLEGLVAVISFCHLPCGDTFFHFLKKVHVRPPVSFVIKFRNFSSFRHRRTLLYYT